MNLVSRIIPGALNIANRDTIDWSHHGLLAYGCQSTVVVLDPQSFRVKIACQRDDRYATLALCRFCNAWRSTTSQL